MNFIIEGNFDRALVSSINKEDLPVSHIVVHVPGNPLGNGSIFLPKEAPSFEDFKNYTKFIKDHGIIPIAGIDSTCQGNLEAHIDQYKAISSLFENLFDLEYDHMLVSAPNNIGMIKEMYPSVNVFLSYSQYTTSINRARIFFDIGADSIILHPDIIRNFNALEHFLKLKDQITKKNAAENPSRKGYILPLNLGCNWGCIQWYQHHNVQSHRTINSPVFSNQEAVSNVNGEFDYPLLYCWKKRIENPLYILKSGWISPYNIQLYENLGYHDFFLVTTGFPAHKSIDIMNSYLTKEMKLNFNEFLNIPLPYNTQGTDSELQKLLIQLEPSLIKEFCENFPYRTYYPSEEEVDNYCQQILSKVQKAPIEQKNSIITQLTNKMREMERGAIKR
ncbi:MAG: hypothetical protein BAJALOKI1v1_1200007 [Promethearchaeota archaeon]|nr:MAG: hypothetical protein BAJALOKI1v1_1200007 [Candidatus Lokiarchaeota archaeon]